MKEIDFEISDRDENPCENCSFKDVCDGWEAQFCCERCMYYGLDDCDNCNPMDI